MENSDFKPKEAHQPLIDQISSLINEFTDRKIMLPNEIRQQLTKLPMSIKKTCKLSGNMAKPNDDEITDEEKLQTLLTDIVKCFEKHILKWPLNLRLGVKVFRKKNMTGDHSETDKSKNSESSKNEKLSEEKNEQSRKLGKSPSKPTFPKFKDGNKHIPSLLSKNLEIPSKYSKIGTSKKDAHVDHATNKKPLLKDPTSRSDFRRDAAQKYPERRPPPAHSQQPEFSGQRLRGPRPLLESAGRESIEHYRGERSRQRDTEIRHPGHHGYDSHQQSDYDYPGSHTVTKQHRMAVGHKDYYDEYERPPHFERYDRGHLEHQKFFEPAERKRKIDDSWQQDYQQSTKEPLIRGDRYQPKYPEYPSEQRSLYKKQHLPLDYEHQMREKEERNPRNYNARGSFPVAQYESEWNSERKMHGENSQFSSGNDTKKRILSLAGFADNSQIKNIDVDALQQAISSSEANIQAMLSGNSEKGGRGSSDDIKHGMSYKSMDRYERPQIRRRSRSPLRRPLVSYARGNSPPGGRSTFRERSPHRGRSPPRGRSPHRGHSPGRGRSPMRTMGRPQSSTQGSYFTDHSEQFQRGAESKRPPLIAQHPEPSKKSKTKVTALLDMINTYEPAKEAEHYVDRRSNEARRPPASEWSYGTQRPAKRSYDNYNQFSHSSNQPTTSKELPQTYGRDESTSAAAAAMSQITSTIAGSQLADLGVLIDQIKSTIDDPKILQVLNQVVLIARSLGDALSPEAKAKILQDYAVTLLSSIS